MSILLTDEEILDIQNEYAEESRAFWGGAFSRDKKTEMAFALSGVPSRTAKAQLKKVVGYLRERWNGTEYGFYNIVAIPKEDWQSLLKECDG